MIERATLEAMRWLRERGEPFVIATVIRVHGSAYRRPGARMVITREGWLAGSVSGGCLEGDVARRAWWLTEQRPAIITYDSSAAGDADPDELRAAFGLGCGGVVDVLLERHDPAWDVLALADHWMQAQRHGAIATPLDGDDLGVRVALADDGAEYGAIDPALRHALADGSTGHRSIGGREWLIEAIRPAPRLFVFGTGHDAVPVVDLARRLGWDVIVCARHMRHGIRDRFARADAIVVGLPEELAAHVDAADRALAVVMSHDVELDREHLAMLLGSRAIYIGVLGPRARTAKILDRRDARIHAPVGLELGAETPEEIALSIVAEIQAVLARSPATSLREHVGPIHAA